ncbi:hypothetical protein [Brachybacterium sp. GPGPB12]
MITAEDGEVSEELVLDEEITAWRPLSGGRALVSTDEGTVALGG